MDTDVRLSRHGEGARADLSAAASQIHPVFMLPPVAAAWFGSVLIAEPSIRLAAVHAGAVFAAVYTAHVKDGYVDYHVRGEDDDHSLTADGCRTLLALASVAFFGCLAALWWAVGAGAALLTLPCWLIGYNHAPTLDTNPVTATAGYPTGIALAIVGGAYVQAESLVPVALAFGAVFLVVLSGVKVLDDAQDYEYDRSIAKRTVAVVLGMADARRFAYALMAIGLAAVFAFVAAGLFPPSAALAPVAFAAVAAVASRGGPSVATKLLIRGSYVFLALLLVAVAFEPFAATGL